MNQKKLRKNNKLTEFRDKLAQLNEHTSKDQSRQKLKQFCHQNQKIQAEISSVLNQISEYELKNSQHVLSITNQLVQTVREVSQQLLDRLQGLKHRQLQNIKEDVQNFIEHQKTVKRVIGLFNKKDQILYSPKINSDQAIKQLQKLKFFNTHGINQKISESRRKKEEIQHMIQNFGEIQGLLKNVIVKQGRKIKRESQTPSIQSKLRLNQGTQYEAYPQCSSIQKIMENINQHDRPMKSLETQKQQNLMEQSPLIQLSRDQENVRKQIYYSSQIVSSEQRTQRVEPMTRMQDQQSKNKIKYTITNILSALKKQYKIKEESDKGEKQSEIGTDQKIIRVRSQQNISKHSQHDLNFLKKSQTNIGGMSKLNIDLQNMETVKISKIDDSFKLSTGQRHFKKQNSTRRGNWASILKDQQDKYSQIRRQIKK